MDVIKQLSKTKLLDNLKNVSDKIFICLESDKIKVTSGDSFSAVSLNADLSVMLKKEFKFLKIHEKNETSDSNLEVIVDSKLLVKEELEIKMVSVKLQGENEVDNSVKQDLKVTVNGIKTLHYNDHSSSVEGYHQEKEVSRLI